MVAKPKPSTPRDSIYGGLLFDAAERSVVPCDSRVSVSGDVQDGFDETDTVLATGSRIVNLVPWKRPPKRVRRRMVPPYFSTIPDVTQRPSPVPRSPLVVKKGSKMRSR